MCQSEDSLLSGIYSLIFMFEIVHNSTYFWKWFWGALKFQRAKKIYFWKAWTPWIFQWELAAVGFAEILIPQHAEYLLHHLMSKHATPMGDLHHEDAEIRCVLPTVRSSSSLCLKGLVHISCLGSTIQSVEGVTQHLLLFPGWMKAQVFLAESLGLWNCNASVHVSLCMCLGNMVGPEIFVLRAQTFSGEKHRR